MADETTVPAIPNLELCELFFTLSREDASMEHRTAAAQDLMAGIEQEEMAPFLARLVAEQEILSQLPNSPKDTLERLSKKNDEELARLDEKIKDATENLGETEVSDALRSKASYLAKIGEKEKAIDAYQTAFDKQAGIGSKIDLRLAAIRVGFFHLDYQIISQYTRKAEDLINEGGDWDRRNRLKAYKALHSLSVRDFKEASEHLLAILPTFTATELFSYHKFIEYSILAGTLCLSRRDLKTKVVEAPEVIQTLPELPNLTNYTQSLYNAEYAQFFQSLALVEEHHLIPSRWLSPHARYYVREMRIKAYSQLLESYRSVTMTNLAAAFGVHETFLDADLSRFIANGRLNCSIDKVNGIVETNRPDSKNALYEQAIKQGDILLNSTQRLSRVVGS